MPVLEAISTYIDIVDLIPQLTDSDDVKKFTVLKPVQIRAMILRNDEQLRSQLELMYGTALASTPRVHQPTPDDDNTGDATLLVQDSGTGNVVSVLESSEVLYSQVYEIKFTDAAAFDVKSELSGNQGSGSTAAEYTTADTFLTIPKECWNDTPIADDIFYVRVYNYSGMLVHLSSLLTAAYILDTVYTEEVPDASAAAGRYTRLYNSLIKALQSGKIKLSDNEVLARDIDPIQVDYEIDDFGRDITNYEDDEWPRSSFSDY